MNPRERKLRLRKSTVRDLNPEVASRAFGGTVELDTKSMWLICTLFRCTDSDMEAVCPRPAPGTEGCQETRAFSNCLACQSYAPTCQNQGCDTNYPCLLPL